MARLGAWIGTAQLDRQLRMEWDAKLCRDFANRFPTPAGVRTEGLALDEGDALMAKLLQVLQRLVRGLPVIELHTDCMLIVPVTGDCNHRHRNMLADFSIHSNDAIDGARDHEARIGLQQFRVMKMAGDEIKQALLQQSIFNTA